MAARSIQATAVYPLPVIFTSDAARLAEFYAAHGLQLIADGSSRPADLLIVSPACGLPGLHMTLAGEGISGEDCSAGEEFCRLSPQGGYQGALRLACRDEAAPRPRPLIHVDDILMATRWCSRHGLQTDTSRISQGIVAVCGNGRSAQLRQQDQPENALSFLADNQPTAPLVGIRLPNGMQINAAPQDEQPPCRELRDPDGNLLQLPL